MNVVGDRVRFVGPSYRWADSPHLGQEGEVVEADGHTAATARAGVGGGVDWDEVEVLVTVLFDGDERATVLGVSRLESCDE